MPTNLPPEYAAAEEEYYDANTPKQKMDALRKMLSVIPKHKGTEKLVAQLRQALPRDNGEPLGLVAPLAVRRSICTCDSEAKRGHGTARGRVPHLRVSAQIPNNRYSIQSCHRTAS